MIKNLLLPILAGFLGLGLILGGYRLGILYFSSLPTTQIAFMLLLAATFAVTLWFVKAPRAVAAFFTGLAVALASPSILRAPTGGGHR